MIGSKALEQFPIFRHQVVDQHLTPVCVDRREEVQDGCPQQIVPPPTSPVHLNDLLKDMARQHRPVVKGILHRDQRAEYSKRRQLDKGLVASHEEADAVEHLVPHQQVLDLVGVQEDEGGHEFAHVEVVVALDVGELTGLDGLFDVAEGDEEAVSMVLVKVFVEQFKLRNRSSILKNRAKCLQLLRRVQVRWDWEGPGLFVGC